MTVGRPYLDSMPLLVHLRRLKPGIKVEVGQPFVDPPDLTWLYPKRPPTSTAIFRCYCGAPMNVLLAEADIPYEKLKEMDEINPTFRQTNLALVIGANNVVNPLAREADQSIPIAGMPILDVDQARAVVVVKRSLSPGFAGIPNPLFAADNTLMLFGDAERMLQELTTSLSNAHA